MDGLSLWTQTHLLHKWHLPKWDSSSWSLMLTGNRGDWKRKRRKRVKPSNTTNTVDISLSSHNQSIAIMTRYQSHNLSIHYRFTKSFALVSLPFPYIASCHSNTCYFLFFISKSLSLLDFVYRLITPSVAYCITSSINKLFYVSTCYFIIPLINLSLHL